MKLTSWAPEKTLQSCSRCLAMKQTKLIKEVQQPARFNGQQEIHSKRKTYRYVRKEGTMEWWHLLKQRQDATTGYRQPFRHCKNTSAITQVWLVNIYNLYYNRGQFLTLSVRVSHFIKQPCEASIPPAMDRMRDQSWRDWWWIGY